MATCVICTGNLAGRQAKYCSLKCKNDGYNRARAADGRLREYRQRTAARSVTYHQKRSIGGTGLAIATCAGCGADTGRVARSDKHKRVCSLLCRSFIQHGYWPSSKVPARIVPRPRQQVSTPRRDQRGPLRRAWEDHDWDTVRTLMLDRTVDGPDGCRAWTGRRNKEGYAVLSIGTKQHSAYRVMVLAVAGTELGALHVHHICANGMCIAPNHLQIVTASSNTAEMLHRRWYEDRIKQLERALAHVDPANEALTALPLVIRQAA